MPQDELWPKAWEQKDSVCLLTKTLAYQRETFLAFFPASLIVDDEAEVIQVQIVGILSHPWKPLPKESHPDKPWALCKQEINVCCVT